jgi:hypothetical protein
MGFSFSDRVSISIAAVSFATGEGHLPRPGVACTLGAANKTNLQILLSTGENHGH